MADSDLPLLLLLGAGAGAAVLYARSRGGEEEGEVEEPLFADVGGLGLGFNPGFATGLDPASLSGGGDFSGSFAPEGGLTPFEQTALQQQREGFEGLEDNQTSLANRDLAIFGGVAAAGLAGRQFLKSRAQGRAARSTSGATGGSRAAQQTKTASRVTRASTSTQTASRASRAASTASRTSRVTQAARRASTAARAVARTPAVRVAGRVAGRVAAPIAVATSVAGGVKTGQRALEKGYSKPEATALAASDSALRVATLGLVTGNRVLKARNSTRRFLRRVF